jgi:hypothetical protein
MVQAKVSTEADRMGRFRVRLAAGDTIRLRILDADERGGSPVETSWITV